MLCKTKLRKLYSKSKQITRQKNTFFLEVSRHLILVRKSERNPYAFENCV